MKKILLHLTFLLLCFNATAQPPQGGMPPSAGGPKMNIGRLYGKIVDANTKEPLPYASVTAYMTIGTRDSLLGGMLTLENGEFNITGLPFGAYKVKVAFVGYKDFMKMARVVPPNNVEQDLGDLALAGDSKVLGTVEVNAEKAGTQLSLEKRVFNVDKNITSTGGTAEDVLKNVPSVTVDMDGSAKLRDRGTTIYVDGKPTVMSLTQIPADQIESVEVISNPSAKYEAATSGGILNIVLKKNRKPGYNGIVSAGVGTQGRYNGMFSLNLREGRFNFTSFYNINASNNPAPGYAYRTNLNPDGSIANYFNQYTDTKFNTNFQIGRIGMDYSINNRNTLTVSGTRVGGKFNINSDQDYEFLNTSRDTIEYGNRLTQPRNTFNNTTVEGQWVKTFAKKDKSLTTLFNYGWGTGSNAAQWTTTGFDANDQVLLNYPELVNINGDNKNQQAVFQMDYVKPLNDSTKLEYGVRSFWSGRDQEYLFSPFDYEKNAYVQDSEFSQNNRITEMINAAYINFSSRFKNQITYQIGLRFEQSNLTGDSKLDDRPDFGYDYPNKGKDILNTLFPSIYIAKKLANNGELGVNFSRKIQRPNFMQIMPGIQNNDRQNIRIGNPSLQPEFINLAEINYNKIFGKHNWLSTIYTSIETNSIKPLSLPSENDPSVLVTTFVNGQNEVLYGFDNTLKLAFGKNMDILLNANVFNFSVNVDTFSNTGWAGNGKVSLSYRLPASFSVQINGAYEGNRPQPQGDRKGIAYADFAIKKSFFNNIANITFNINDVFNTRREITFLELTQYEQESMRRRDTRFYRISIQIPFGKPDASIFKKRPERQQQEQPDFGN